MMIDCRPARTIGGAMALALRHNRIDLYVVSTVPLGLVLFAWIDNYLRVNRTTQHTQSMALVSVGVYLPKGRYRSVKNAKINACLRSLSIGCLFWIVIGNDRITESIYRRDG